MTPQKPFRNSAAFGKRIEYWIIGRMLKEGLDVYIPLVDDHAVDAIIKRKTDRLRRYKYSPIHET